MRWVFTFGCGQPNAGHYVVIEGEFFEARRKMMERYGRQWSMQYSEREWERICRQAREEGLEWMVETPLDDKEQ